MRRVLLLLVVITLAACVTPVDFMPAKDLNLINRVEITNIADFEKLIKNKKIKTIFYTDEYFIIEISSVMYVLKSRGYKNFHDYKEGKLEVPDEYSIFKPGYSLKRK
jgi:hypothetical protein